MTPQYIAAKLSLLPRFKVEKLERESSDSTGLMTLTGVFSKPVGSGDQSTYLYLSDLRSIYGLLLAKVASRSSRRFEQHWVTEVTDEELLSSKLYYFGAYQVREFYLALDPEIQWIEVDFIAQKALQSRFIGTDGKSYRKLERYQEGETIPEGAIVLESGWDHEHCNFCDSRIEEGIPGYTSTMTDLAGEWACAWCYRNAVEPHDPRPLLTKCVDRS